jgi:hypothetical protein
MYLIFFLFEDTQILEFLGVIIKLNTLLTVHD